MIRPYVVRYSGLWLGGKAVVMANSVEEAKELVEKHPKTMEFTHVRVEKWYRKEFPCVIYGIKLWG
ncbi:MAG: hypothetical protein ACXABY_13110 [Candidatus Thorarchaeota archaeon]|jgi:hypothetical protein